MSNTQFYIIPAAHIRSLRRTLRLCNRIVEAAFRDGIFVDEARLVGPVKDCLWYFEKSSPTKRLTTEELEKIF